jgi:lysophospholipase L1-like esterase
MTENVERPAGASKTWLSRAKRFILYPLYLLLISLLLLEISMIVLEPYLFKGFFQYEPEIGFRVRPYALNSNQFGFNDQDYPLEKAPGTYRILVLGDSFGWAGGREHNYTALLEKKFERLFGEHRVDVINAGYPMTHTAEQLLILQKYALQYNPDLVFLGFFTGNDFVDADPNRKRIVVNDVYFDIDKRKELTVFGYPIVLKSRFLHFLKQKYQVYRHFNAPKPKLAEKPGASPHTAPSPASKPAPKKEQGTHSVEAYLAIQGAKLHFFNLRKHEVGEYDPHVNYIFKSLRDMKALLDSGNIDFIVGIYPDELHVNDELFDQVIDRFDFNREDYDLLLAQKLLKAFLDEEKIPYIDLTDDFVEESKEQTLYLLRDTHWNTAGNELAADLILETLLPFIEQHLPNNHSPAPANGQHRQQP